MAKTGFLQYDNENAFLPITRGELVRDGSGNEAFRSGQFLASDSQHGLMSATDKAFLQGLNSGTGGVVVSNPLKFKFISGTDLSNPDFEQIYEYNGSTPINLDICAGTNVLFESVDDQITIQTSDPTVLQDTFTKLEGTSLKVPVLLADPEAVDKKGITYTQFNKTTNEGFCYDVINKLLYATVTYTQKIATGGKGVGGVNQPVYVHTDDCIKALTGNGADGDDQGSTFKPIYLKDGVLTKANATIGGPDEVDDKDGFKLMYMSQGNLTPCSDDVYIGGPTDDDTFYLTYVHKGAIVPADTTIGSAIQGVYMAEGQISPMTYTLEANVKPGTSTYSNPGYLAMYWTDTEIRKLIATIGNSRTPVYMDKGVLTPIKINANSNSPLYITGITSSSSGFYTGTQNTSGVRILSGNSVYASGGFYESSDETKKSFKEDLKVNFESLRKIPKKYFTWIEDDSKQLHIGTSAQKLQQVYPELVAEDESGSLNVAYDKLSVVALKAVDDLYELVVTLQENNKQLQDRLIKLEQAVYGKE